MDPRQFLVIAAGIGFAAGYLYAGHQQQPAPAAWFPRHYGTGHHYFSDRVKEARPFATEQACVTWLKAVLADWYEDYEDELRCEKGVK
jgi:hypothetical protein